MEYEEIQNRKLISAYGGVGSIIETRKGAIKVAEFDKWPFFVTKEAEKPENFISDERFKARLKILFNDLKELVRLPENQLVHGFRPENNKLLISATYFPKWMYCTSCRIFDNYDNWKTNWNNSVEEKHRDWFHPRNVLGVILTIKSRVNFTY